MIFVTVGTHEQPFDRLLREIDRLAATGALPEEVFCQTGYSTYTPQVPSARMLSHDEMQARIALASLVVAHGGPGSILPVLARRKPLVLVPRQRRFGEHVDDHQVTFCRRVGRERGVPVVEDVAQLGPAIALVRGTDRGPPPTRSTTNAAVERLRRLIAQQLARRT